MLPPTRPPSRLIRAHDHTLRTAFFAAIDSDTRVLRAPPACVDIFIPSSYLTLLLSLPTTMTPMRILLPPSESKATPATGLPLNLSSLTWSALTPAREQILSELTTICRADDALEILGVGSRCEAEVRRQRDLLTAPCVPARELYTGVLYDAARLRPGDEVTIFSGLFGATSGEDLLPHYRLAMGVRLPKAGRLSSYWRHVLSRIPFLDDEPVVDMRSSGYQVCKPQGQWWQVQARTREGKVISHMVKHYRGLLTRALLDAHSEEIADVARSLEAVADVRVEKSSRENFLLELVVERP